MPDDTLGIIGQERALIDALTKALHNAGRAVGDYTKIRDTRRGNYFEIRLAYGRVARVTVELDRVE